MISVIVPVYNCQSYLGNCLGSIINQSYKDIEVILVNDGSTDDSLRICQAYACRDSRIRVINSENFGPAKARNIGIEQAKGEFIFFVDADDFIKSNALELLLGSYNRYSADLVVGDFKKIQDGESASGHKSVFPESRLLDKQGIVDYVRRYLKSPNRFPLFVYSWGRLFKSSIIKENGIFFDISLRTFEDVAFNFDYLKYTNTLFFLDDAICSHLIHNNYSSAAMAIGGDPGRLFGYRKALLHAGDFLNSCNLSVDIKGEVAHAYLCYTIIQTIRSCGQLNSTNKEVVYGILRNVVNDPKLQEGLRFYAPLKGDSKIIPLLMRLKFIYPLMLVCRYKAQKRYKISKHN